MTAKDRHVIAPRRLSAAQAAAYLGYETTAVLANIPVKPRALVARGPGSQPMYDRVELDAWLDRLAGLSVPAANADQEPGKVDAEEAFAQWRAGRATG